MVWERLGGGGEGEQGTQEQGTQMVPQFKRGNTGLKPLVVMILCWKCFREVYEWFILCVCVWFCFFFPRQNKLEEALLFSGQFTDALQALIDWLYKIEPQLAEDQPVHGDTDLVMNLIDNHKVILKILFFNY